MNINTTVTTNNINRDYKAKQNRPAFGSAADVVTQGLRYLNVNEAIGATLVDVGFMAMPRTIVDSKRGFDAGVETGIRENSGTLNHVMIGTIGGAAALALSKEFNKTYNVYSHSIFANNETIDILGQIWHKNYAKKLEQRATDSTAKEIDAKALRGMFFNDVFSNLKGLNSTDGKTANWVGLTEDTVNILEDTCNKLATSQKLRGKKIPKEKMDYLRNLIISDIGAEKELKLIGANGKEATFPISSFLEDVVALGRAFSTRKVSKAFEEAQNDFSANKFIKNLKNLKMRSAIVALSISSALGASVQPFNRWLTKKRTGSSGFVGVPIDKTDTKATEENKTSDSSPKFMLAKATAATGMLGLALSSITTNFKELPNKIQFKGKIPTLNHYKLVYGITVASRFLAARSGDELREACFKDILGFTNWLILGGFVSKAVVTALDGEGLLNSKNNKPEKGFLNWLTNKSVKTADEVLLKDLAAKGVKTVKDGKAIPFKTLLEEAKKQDLPGTLKKIKYLNIAQLAGYLYSGLVLGILIPKLNIKMTAMNNEKRKKQAQQQAETTPVSQLLMNRVKTDDLKNTIFAQFGK